MIKFVLGIYHGVLAVYSESTAVIWCLCLYEAIDELPVVSDWPSCRNKNWAIVLIAIR